MGEASQACDLKHGLVLSEGPVVMVDGSCLISAHWLRPDLERAS